VVEDAAGRSNDDVGARVERLLLGAIGDAAID